MQKHYFCDLQNSDEYKNQISDVETMAFIRDETRVLITRVISRVISKINTRVIKCKIRVLRVIKWLYNCIWLETKIRLLLAKHKEPKQEPQTSAILAKDLETFLLKDRLENPRNSRNQGTITANDYGI